MAKPNRLTAPVTITKAELMKMGEINPDIKKYVTAVLPLLDNSPDSVAGKVEIRSENGMPVLRFTPYRVPMADLLRNKLG
jgi:hypothetical protein